MNKLFLPLCEDCMSTTYCIDNNLRTSSFPLDWIITSPVRALHCLKNNFKDIYRREDVKVVGMNPNIKLLKSKYSLFNKKYKFLMPHLILDLEVDILKMQEKMQKRAARLINYFKNRIPLEVIYRPLSKINSKSVFFDKCYTKSEKKEFGLDNMNVVFPKLKDFLVRTYGYNTNNISLTTIAS